MEISYPMQNTRATANRARTLISIIVYASKGFASHYTPSDSCLQTKNNHGKIRCPMVYFLQDNTGKGAILVGKDAKRGRGQ
jgi:hypothetical protein